MWRHVSVSLACSWCAATSWADPPEVTQVFPPGGQRGTEVTIKLTGKIDTSAVQVWFDRPGIDVAGAEGKDALKLKIAADAQPGIVWWRAYNPEGASALKPFLLGVAREVLEAEPNNALTKAQTVGELPVTVNGVLDKGGEVDTFRVSLKKGQTLVAVLAARQTLGSPMDGSLQIVDARNFVLEQNDDQRGFDPRIVFTAPYDGDFFVRTFAFPAQPDTNINFSGAATYVYRLTMTNGPFLDRVLPAAALANQVARVRPQGWNLPTDGPEIDIGPLPAGVRSVFPAGWESTAKVLVSADPVVLEQEPNPPTQPQTVTPPVMASGVIGQAKDVDAWKFTAKASQRLSIRLSAVSLGSALDAVVRIFDAAGQKLSEVDDAVQDEADVVLEFTAPKDGDYVVSVTDRFSHGGPGYWYVLSLAEPRPSAVLQAAADAFAVKAETPLEVPITIDRRLGYVLPLKIAVEGLPEGVTCDPVVSEPQGESSKAVKLMIKSTRAERWSGPIRIVGRADGDSMPERAARTRSPLIEDWLTTLWLTAGPK